jgi:DNA polymerase I-like protein with 3'-5' exonuclease and polymerase domains
MGLGEKFRRCVVASPGCYLLEADYAGIEAVEVGWFANDPQYIRLAKMSTHAFITTHMTDFTDKIAQVDWDDQELREYLAWVKHNKDYKLLYNRAKRVVHGSNYGLTAKGLRLTYPDDFPSVAAAQKVIDLMFDIFPSVKSWQSSVRQRAHEQHYLGGEEHPFRYKHWFWNVFTFKRITDAQRRARQANGGHCAEIDARWYAVYPGEDNKRCIAFYPQSTSGGVLREAMLKLFTPDSDYYIGDVYYGRTPFRMPIHDSIVLEVPKSKLDFTVDRLYRAMSAPILQQPNPPEWHAQHGTHLMIDVEMELGKDWGEMEKVKL